MLDGLDAKCQTESPYEIVGKVSKYIVDHKPQEACEWTLKAAKADSNTLNAIFDYNIFSHLAFRDSLTQTCTNYLRKIRATHEPVILRKTQSLWLLVQLMDPKFNSNSDMLLMDMWRLLETEMNAFSRNDIYLLKALNYLKTVSDKTPKQTDLILLSIQKAALRVMPDGPPESMTEAQLNQRARCRFRIREACYLSHVFHQNHTDSVTMQLLGVMNPDRFDRAHEFVFEADWVLLHGIHFWKMKATGELPYGYYDLYISWLKQQGQFEKAFNESAVQLYMFPSRGSLESFYEMAESANQTQHVSEVLHRTFNLMSPAFPMMVLNEIKGTTDTFPSGSQRWILGDIWGTWCPPCIKELPEIQHYADSCKPLPHIRFVTFTFQSPGVATFMEKCGYHFPVYPVDDNFNELLHIEGFPMKIIISPEGKYRLMPYRDNWASHMQELIPH